ncbi:MAG TPA: Rho termination factor N-terminal domain-containing protein, partial [Armatimonadota bacterium]|nr:Rho termination factor N-terminal domain-containing protein [Armatimonadota bacterium]
MDQFELSDLEQKTFDELREIAKELGIEDGFEKKQDLVFKILATVTQQSGLIFDQGVLEILPDGWGFLRHNNFSPSPTDVYVSQSQIKRFGLKTGDTISGEVRPPKDNEKYYSLLRVKAVNGLDPDAARRRKNFDDLVPIYPNERLVLETCPENISARFIDL